MITLNVNSLENAEIFWKELGLEDEIALNEDFNCIPQTLAISVEYIDEIYDKVVALGLQVSPITASVNGKHMFSFVAPEGNTFILIGEWVEEPYNGDKRALYFENISNVTVSAPSELSELTDEVILFFGRVTCPWCRRLSHQIKNVDRQIFYIDTEDTDINPALKTLRDKYDVATVPTVIKHYTDGTFIKFDAKSQSLQDFVK